MKKVIDYIILLVQGFIYGLFEMIPFFRTDFFIKFAHYKLNDDDDLKNDLFKNWTFYLGSAIGIIFFFAFPLFYLKENYLYTIGYIYLAIIIINFIASIIVALIRKTSWLKMLINFASSATIVIILYFVNLSDVLALNNFGAYSLIAFIIAIFTFISLYSNVTISSFIVFVSIYFQFADKLNKFALLQQVKSECGFVFFILLGLILGLIAFKLFDNKIKIDGKECSSIPFYILALIIVSQTISNHSPIPNLNKSKIATTILFSTSLIAVICITLVFAIYGVLSYLKTLKKIQILTDNIESNLED